MKRALALIWFNSNGFIMFVFTVLQKAFNSFDSQKSGSIPCDMVADILRLMGQPFDKKILEELIDEVDEDSKFKHFKFTKQIFNIKLISV